MLRIMGGADRGRKLKSPRGTEFRPSTGRVKEFIFSYLYDVQDCEFLDLFSGTGSIGIDAISRGAGRGTFVESSSHHLQLLRDNLTACRYTDRTAIIKGDVFEVIKDLGERSKEFGLVFADPPFKEMYRQKIVSGVAESGILKAGGLLIIEHEKHDQDSGDHSLKMIRQRKFGHCIISIYRN